jgi:hypothetical protein
MKNSFSMWVWTLDVKHGPCRDAAVRVWRSRYHTGGISHSCVPTLTAARISTQSTAATSTGSPWRHGRDSGRISMDTGAGQAPPLIPLRPRTTYGCAESWAWEAIRSCSIVRAYRFVEFHWLCVWAALQLLLGLAILVFYRYRIHFPLLLLSLVFPIVGTGDHTRDASMRHTYRSYSDLIVKIVYIPLYIKIKC